MTVRILILMISLTLPIITYGQSDSFIENMIEKIDSIADVNKIDNAKIYFNKISSYGDETVTINYCVAKEQKFYFDRIFLVVNDKYFNMDKLLYFTIKENYLEFYFQSY